MDKNCHKYSTGVLLLGTGNIFEYFRNLLMVSKLPIISVGSGNGIIEQDIEKEFNIKIICIDPTPLSWSFSIHNENRLADYPLVNDLIKNKKYLTNACNLFINWSYPDCSYDIESIIKLKPKNIIIITDVGYAHGAGSCELHDFLKECGVTTSTSTSSNTINYTKKYNYIYRTFTHYNRGDCILECSIIWLSRDITNNNMNSVKVENSQEYIDACQNFIKK